MFFLFVLLGVSAMACDKYVSNDDEVSGDGKPLYGSIQSAIDASFEGGVICVRKGSYDSFVVENYRYPNPLVITGDTDQGVANVALDSLSGSGGLVRNSSNVHIRRLVFSGGLYGIYIEDSSYVDLVSNTIFNVGQEGITITATEGRLSESVVIWGNTIFDTGLANTQYGEGIYIGNGNSDVDALVRDVEVSSNVIYRTGNEAIDIKSNTELIGVVGNRIFDIDLHFNGAITVGTEASIGAAGGYRVLDNLIYGVGNRNGYRPFAIAVGHGNAVIEDNRIMAMGANAIGICLFTTFINSEANSVYLSGNQSLDLNWMVNERCGSGGTGSDYPAVVNGEQF